MKFIIFVSLFLFSVVPSIAGENSQDCFCPTCPAHKKKCVNTGDQFKRVATKHKVETKPVKAPSNAKGAKGSGL